MTSTHRSDDSTVPVGSPPAPDMVWVPGGSYTMGSDRHYPEEAPAMRVEVAGFWMDQFQVRNADFADFVDDTGYVTVAERPLDPAKFPGAPPENLTPGSMVFKKSSSPVDLRDYTNWWSWIPGASWVRPEGPESSLARREDHPVVHVAYEDAAEYARWAGKTLPTEVEWERAARGGLEGAEFTWGDEKLPNGAPPANWWQGEFPWENTLADGYERTSPVGSFAPNGYALYDMAGNVWEWTADWFVLDRTPSDGCCTPAAPRTGTEQASYNVHRPQFQVPRKVLKGGSFLCADNYCMRYRPAARQAQDVDTGMSHLGFRCIARPATGHAAPGG